jgi:tetratricopeptide (TPR) repeat protein
MGTCVVIVGGEDRPGSSGGRNRLGGTVYGSAVQANTVHGGVHLYQRSETLVPVPRQLPAPAPLFVGRARELLRLDRMCGATGYASDSDPGSEITAGGGTRLVVLNGPAGVGKTALGLTWLHGNLERFPDGQLHANLHAFGEPVSPLALLYSFLIAFGVAPDRIPAGLADCAALYRSVTASRRVALLLDGAASSAQVRPLIPGGRHAVTVVTSTWRLAGLALDGASWLPLAPLPVPESVRLLAGIAGTDRITDAAASAAAREVARLCGGLPLALCMVGAQLAARPHQGLTEMAAELADEHKRLERLTAEGDGLRQVIDVCYRELPQDAARIYRILGALPISRFSAAAVAAACALTADDAREALRLLADANLLQQTGPDGYAFHDLVRLHAKETSDREEFRAERDGAVARTTDWYLAGAIAASTTVRPYRRDVPAPVTGVAAPLEFEDLNCALDWLEAEAPQLLSIARHASAHGHAELALQVSAQMWALFVYRRPYELWRAFDLLGLECARALGDTGWQARMLRRLGRMYTDVGRYEEATDALTRALQLYTESGDRHREATVLNSLGVVLLRRGEARDGAEVITRALEIHRDLGDTRQIGTVLIDLGDALIESDRSDQALALLLEAAESLDGSPDVYSLARLRTLIGRAQARTGAYAQARNSLDAALEAMRSVDSGFGRAEALGYLGELAERLDEQVTAESCYTQAAELLTGLGAPQETWLVHRVRGLTPLARRVLDRDPSG